MDKAKIQAGVGRVVNAVIVRGVHFLIAKIIQFVFPLFVNSYENHWITYQSLRAQSACGVG